MPDSMNSANQSGHHPTFDRENISRHFDNTILSNLYLQVERGLLRNVPDNREPPALQFMQSPCEAGREGDPLLLPKLP